MSTEPVKKRCKNSNKVLSVQLSEPLQLCKDRNNFWLCEICGLKPSMQTIAKFLRFLRDVLKFEVDPIGLLENLQKYSQEFLLWMALGSPTMESDPKYEEFMKYFDAFIERKVGIVALGDVEFKSYEIRRISRHRKDENADLVFDENDPENAPEDL